MLNVLKKRFGILQFEYNSEQKNIQFERMKYERNLL